MADKKISALTGATTPLAGTEVLPIVQSGSTVKVAVSDLTAGRAVGANGLTSTANIRVQYSAAGNVSSVANNTAATAGSMSQFISTNDASRSLRVQYSASGGAGGSALTNGISTETAQVFTDGNYPIVFGTNVSAALILDTSQNARIINNLIIGTAGKGIDFSANANAPGMTSELLNWYEQGTFTPVLSSSGTPPTVTSYTTQYGAYTRIGNRVFVSVQLRATLSAVGTGYPVITGFPYAAAGNSFNGPSFGLTTMLNLGANSYHNGSTLNLLGSTYTLAGDYLTFSLMYEV